MVEFLFANFYGICGAILAACFGAYLVWRNGYKSRRATACAIFRSAVLVELGSIYPKAVDWPNNTDNFFKSHFTALQTAVENFRPFVPRLRRPRFDRAWLCFYSAYPDQVNEQCYHHYLGSYSEGTQAQATEKAQSLFHANITRLLSFADET